MESRDGMLDRMRFWLRQDFVHMVVQRCPLPVSAREAVNERYQFSFPSGLMGTFVLAAISKISGDPEKSRWMEQAMTYIIAHRELIQGDFECRVYGSRIYCVFGTGMSAEDTTKALKNLFSGLIDSSPACTCGWIMGMGTLVSDIAQMKDSIAAADHALKFCIRDGVNTFYDGNQSCAIYEGALTLATASEQVSLKRLFQQAREEGLAKEIREIFSRKHIQINQYPVFAFMLAQHILDITTQTLRDLMPVDRQTYMVAMKGVNEMDSICHYDELVEHTVSVVMALCSRYQLFLSNGRSQPLWLVITYIQEHYRENISLEALAKVADRNPQYISSVFSKSCGMPIKEYITSLRMEEAKRLLRSTSLPIGQIGGMVGYQDSKYFSRIFQRSVGMAPRTYRETEYIGT